jgi:hypothetical protein
MEPSFSWIKENAPPPCSRPDLTHPPTTSIWPTSDAPPSAAVSMVLMLDLENEALYGWTREGPVLTAACMALNVVRGNRTLPRSSQGMSASRHPRNMVWAMFRHTGSQCK